MPEGLRSTPPGSLRAARPRLLDLFCGAGGVAMGYHRAGFDVTGVDCNPQPDYPFTFERGDVTMIGSWWPMWWRSFDAIHASPPCQRYIRGGLQRGEKPDLLGPTRELLEATGLPWVIENVPGAPMRADVVLCGSMFGLPIRRHRWFESNVPVDVMTPPCDHSKPIVGVYGNPHGKAGAWPGMLPGSLESWSEALGIDWMTAPGLAQAIPPAYTELIGTALLAHLMRPGGEACEACGFDALNCQCGDSAFAGTPLENFRPRVGGIGLGSY